MTSNRITITDATGFILVRFNDRKMVDSLRLDQMAEEAVRAVSLASERKKPLVLDFTGVEFLSSAALDKLILLQGSSKQNNVQLILTGLRTEIKEVFEITRLDRVFDIRDFDPRDGGGGLEQSGSSVPSPDSPPTLNGTVQLDEPNSDDL